MASTSETGHAKNVANFDRLIEFVIGWGARYNPSKPAYQLPQLQAKISTSGTSVSFVTKKDTAFNGAVNERIIEFSDVQTLSTRLVNALESTDASKQTIEDAKGYNRKLQGKKAPGQEKPVDENAPVPKDISSSQLSYDQQIQHFEGLRTVLQSEVSYSPNETDLTNTAAEAKQDAMVAKNKAVAKAYTAVSNARIDRDNNLYAEDEGLVDIAAGVKKYVKSAFGATSPEFKQISALEFRKISK